MASEGAIGEVRLFAVSHTIDNWLPCDGQSLAVARYTKLFQIIGNRFGGDGSTTFSLPDLRSRVVISADTASGFAFASRYGEEQHLLTVEELPAHTHTVSVTSQSSNSTSGFGNVLATSADPCYSGGPRNVFLHPEALVPSPGGTQPHTNLQPYLVLEYRICTEGYYPQDDLGEGWIGEIVMLAFSKQLRNWLPCDGRVLPASLYGTLAQLLGTTYGNPTNAVQLPDLRGRTPVASGDSPGLTPRPLGSSGGSAGVELTLQQMPQHSHMLYSGSGTPDSGTSPESRMYAVGSHFSSGSAEGQLAADALASTGGSLPHNNIQPCLALQAVICVAGLFPE